MIADGRSATRFARRRRVPVEDEAYWYSRTRHDHTAPLEEALEADAVVVGGGMAGLAAAQWLREKAGKDVVVLEAQFCGAGATGKSSGFITPDSELELTSLARRFGDADARLLWDAATRGCTQIRANVERFGIECDLLAADSLFVANGRRAFDIVREEHEAHARLGFPSTLYTRASLPNVLGSDGFDGAVRAGGTFGIDAYAYVQGLKRALAGLGVRVFEDSPATQIDRHVVRTARGAVRAPIVIVCLDRFAPTLGVGTRDTYHAQTFIALTERSVMTSFDISFRTGRCSSGTQTSPISTFGRPAMAACSWEGAVSSIRSGGTKATARVPALTSRPTCMRSSRRSVGLRLPIDGRGSSV